MRAEFQASSTHAQGLLERSLASLRLSLESQGLNVERLTVQAPTPTGSQQMREESAEQHSHADQSRQDAAGGESRGRGEHESQDRSATARGTVPGSFDEAFSVSELQQESNRDHAQASVSLT